jgi:hypothetical protein
MIEFAAAQGQRRQWKVDAIALPFPAMTFRCCRLPVRVMFFPTSLRPIVRRTCSEEALFSMFGIALSKRVLLPGERSSEVSDDRRG